MSFQRCSKERSAGLGKAPLETAFGFANFFLWCFIFKRCLIWKREVVWPQNTTVTHLSPEDLELKVSVGRRGGESTALSLLTNSLFKFFSKTAGEGVGRVDRNHPHSASHHCRDVVCRNGACTAKGLLSLRTHTAAARGLSGDSLFGKCQLIAAQTLKGT